jgi:hypothetical protein
MARSRRAMVSIRGAGLLGGQYCESESIGVELEYARRCFSRRD